MWTRKRTDSAHFDPTETWLLSYRGQLFGSVWAVREHWCWVTWTCPHEAGQSPTLDAASADARDAALRTDGTIGPFRSLKGPEFPEEKKRKIWM